MRTIATALATAAILAATIAAATGNAAVADTGNPQANRYMPGLHRIEKADVKQRHVTVTHAERLSGSRFYYELSNGAAWVADRPKACGNAYRPFRCWEAAALAGFDVTNPMTPIPVD